MRTLFMHSNSNSTTTLFSLPGRVVRLKNNDFVRDKLKANVEMQFFKSLNELEAIHELSVQFFHKKAFGFRDSGYFLLSDLTGRNEDFIYLIEFNPALSEIELI